MSSSRSTKKKVNTTTTTTTTNNNNNQQSSNNGWTWFQNLNDWLINYRVCTCCGPKTTTSDGVAWYAQCGSSAASSIHSENLEPQDTSGSTTKQAGKRPEANHSYYMSPAPMAVPGGGRGQGYYGQGDQQSAGYSSGMSAGGGMVYPTTFPTAQQHNYGTFNSQATVAGPSGRRPGDTSSSSSSGGQSVRAAQSYQSSVSSNPSTGRAAGGSQGWDLSDDGSSEYSGYYYD